MEVKVSKEIQENIQLASKELGLSEREVIAVALNLYLKNLKAYTALKEEMNMWEESGARDSSHFLEKNSL